MQGMGKIRYRLVIILLVNRDLIYKMDIIPRIIITNLRHTEEGVIILIILVCTVEEELRHLGHILTTMHHHIHITMEIQEALKIISEDHRILILIIIKCLRCPITLNRDIMADHLVRTIIHLHQICPEDLDHLHHLLLDITIVDTEAHILVPHLLQDITLVDLPHIRISAPIMHLIPIRFLRRGVRDQTSRIRQADPERNEQSRELMIGVKKRPLRYLIRSEGRIVVLVQVIVL